MHAKYLLELLMVRYNFLGCIMTALALDLTGPFGLARLMRREVSMRNATGLTTGSPIKVEVFNTNTRGSDYSEMSKVYRPSHADATYDFKYGLRSIEGGGRSSARETIGRVAAGAIAKKILKQFSGTEVLAYTSRVHKVVLPEDLVDYDTLTLDQVESNIVRCPNPEYAEKMIAAIDAVRESEDSAGGIVTCIVRNVPRGLGSPVFDKLSADLAKAVVSVPASIGFEFGSGFAGPPKIDKFTYSVGSCMTGSEHNDEFYIDENGRIRTKTNRSGGIQKKQKTVTRDKHETELIFPGRQEPCVAPRAVPVVEAMVAMVLVDQLMAQYAQCMLFPINPTLQEPMSSLKTKLDHAVLN
ncbi:Chorismate synthase, chloroplastic [Capsicum annuum]|nr:Chorismate synthase, chloroplastic [Capsicum annuum]